MSVVPGKNSMQDLNHVLKETDKTTLLLDDCHHHDVSDP